MKNAIRTRRTLRAVLASFPALAGPLVAGLFVAATPGQIVLAQETTGAEAPDEGIEEIVVTATKRGAVRLQDLPLTVQAITGNKLENVGATDFEDFFHFVPGLAVFDQGPGDKRIIMRGINAVGAGTVGLYLDEIIITGENAQDGGGRQPDVKLFDLARIEVLKGPQGTTFGSSSLSGTIRYIANKPNLQETLLEVGATVRKTEDADIGGQAGFVVNLPVVEDTFAVRMAGLVQDENGFIDNRLVDGANGEEASALRAMARYVPVDDLTITVMGMYQDVETDGPAYFNRVDYLGNPLPELTQADVTRNPFKDEIVAYNATVDYRHELGTFTGTASVFDRESVFNRDSSYVLDALSQVGAIPVPLPFEGAGRSVITQPKDRTLKSYELRFTSDWDSPVQLLTGVFKQDEERFFQSRILPADPGTGFISGQLTFPTATGRSLDRARRTEIDEIAVFSELTANLTEKLSVTGGLRWFDIDVHEVQTALFNLDGSPGGGRGPDLGFSESDVIGKLNLSYSFTGELLAFMQWSQGFRSGGVNDPGAAELVGATIPAGFGSDSLDAYELGVKSTWLDGKLTANGALYYSDWSDIQLQAQAQGAAGAQFPYTTNGGAAEITGAELVLSARPLEGLDVGFTASWTSAELSQDNPDPSTGLEGDAIPYAPEFTLALTSRYTRPLPFGDLSGFVGGDIFNVDERATEFNRSIPGFMKLEGYAVVNLRAGVQTADWSATLGVDNVFDDDTVVDVYRIIPGLTPDGFIVQQPRTVFFNVNFNF